MEARPRKQILLIEDDTSLVRVLRTLLESFGYDVEAVTCGTAGLACIADTPPDLVILDLRLPDMNGYEVCRRLRQVTNPWILPVLMLTGRDKPVDQLRGYAHGADAYLTKPCEPPELLKTIALLLGESEARSIPAD
jgi:DNA-binding response OmpR family regulator